MLRVLSMCNNNSISRLLLVIILFVFVALVATSNAKSAEALDFDAAFAAEELGHSLQYERGSCNSNTTSISGATKLACIADATIAEEGEEKWHTTRATTQILSRHKRFLAFPLGSSFSCAVCLTTGVVGNPNYQYLSMGLNWGFAYDLPNATWVLDHAHALGRRKNDEDMQKVEEPTIKRRHRRELYHKVETIMNNMGYNGRDCVLRALCESRQYFTRNKMGMIGEMLRVVFSLPKQRLFTRELRENSEIGVYDHAYRKARSVDCATHYDCPFSLLELAFGRYAKPPTDYYEKIGM